MWTHVFAYRTGDLIIEGEELTALYASSDFLVFPSATDTFGNVVLEANASGIPVIVTDKGGPCENTIHRETGLITESGNSEALAEAIALLSMDETLRRQMGENGRQSVEKRGFQQQFEKLWHMYTGETTPGNEELPALLDMVSLAATKLFDQENVTA